MADPVHRTATPQSNSSTQPMALLSEHGGEVAPNTFCHPERSDRRERSRRKDPILMTTSAVVRLREQPLQSWVTLVPRPRTLQSQHASSPPLATSLALD